MISNVVWVDTDPQGSHYWGWPLAGDLVNGHYFSNSEHMYLLEPFLLKLAVI